MGKLVGKKDEKSKVKFGEYSNLHSQYTGRVILALWLFQELNEPIRGADERVEWELRRVMDRVRGKKPILERK